MTTHEFSVLKSYARIFAHTEDDEDELLLLAYQESLRLGSNCPLALLINYMRLSAKSIWERSILPLDEVGKSRLDAFNKEKVSLSKSNSDESNLEEVLSSDSSNPFDDYVADEFACSLNERERNILSELIAGYSVREICSELRISSKTFEGVRASLRSKAGKHLL
jgi:DNA-binding NarL/FixJ family response regulator